MIEKDKIEETYASQFLRSTPVDYKGITLYPVTYENIEMFYNSIYVLLYDPLRYNTEISTLPRLYFITDILNRQEDIVYIQQNMFLLQLFAQLKVLLQLVFKNQIVDFVNNRNKWFLRITKAVEIKEDGDNCNENTNKNIVVDIKAKDFDLLREIILHQNGISYDDTFVHEDIRQWIAEQEKADKSPQPTIEDYTEVFMLQIGSCNLDNINNISLRRFNRIVEKTLSRENYNIQMTASMSGFVSFDKEIEHWLTINKKNSIYDKYFKECK